MHAPHIAFAPSAVSSPSSSSQRHAVAASTATTGPLPLFPPASLPITVSNANGSSSNAYASVLSQAVPPESTVFHSRFDHIDRTGATPAAGAALPRTHLAHAHIITALASSPSSATTTTTTTTTTTPTTKTTAPPTAAPPFSATSLPRTSSLLPPARVAAKTVPIRNRHPNGYPTNNGTTRRALDAPTTIVAASLSTPVERYAYSSLLGPPLDGQARHRPSRSNSVNGAAPDPARLLNRWSTSTGSSRASVAGDRQLYHRHQRSASFSRRLSIDSLGSSFHFAEFEPTASPQQSPKSPKSPKSQQPQQSQQPEQTTPRKLQKPRPGTLSNRGSPLRERESIPVSYGAQGAPSPRRLSPVRTIAPFASLPPIIALPSLEQEVQGGSASFSSAANRMSLQQQQQRRRPHLRQLSSEDNTQSFYFGNAQPSAPTTLQSTMQYSRDHPEVVPVSRAYPRNRSQNANGSTDSTRSNKDRSSKPPSQKAMLSRALQKANTAVQLDNAGNIEGAREAYAEACGLLQQVLLKTPGEEDRRKLEAIKITYTTRIDELDIIASTQQQDTRPLPRRPSSSSGRGRSSSELYSDENADASSDVGPEADEDLGQLSRIYDADDINLQGPAEPRSIPGYLVPQSSSSPRLIQSAFANEHPRHVSSLLNDQYTLQSTFSRSPRKEFIPPHSASATTTNADTMGHSVSLQPPPSVSQYMPPPLSPRRVAPPSRPFEDAPTSYRYDPNEETLSSARYGSTLRPGSAAGTTTNGASAGGHGHIRTASHESVSWLDPINESGSSAASSVHSRTSSLGIRRKHIRAASGATEAEFDAALDDAIEAAYDDGYEPMGPDPIFQQPSLGYKGYDSGETHVSNSLRKVELAKERVRETEREAVAFERQLRLREQMLLQQQQQRDEEEEEEERDRYEREMPRDFLDDGADSDDEERMLEEMTSGLAIEDFAFGLNQKATTSKPPAAKTTTATRESDSSEFTSRTWHSSMAFNPPTATTVLSTVSESSTVLPATAGQGMIAKGSTNTMPPPPTQALPQLPQPPPLHPPPQIPPPQATAARPSTAQGSPVRTGSAMSVRNRRLSGQNMKQLKIETTKLGPPSAAANAPATANNATTSSSMALSASAALPQQPRTAGFLVQQRQALSAGAGGASTTMVIPAVPGIPNMPGVSSSSSRPGSSAAGGSSVPPFSRQAPTPSPGAGTTMFFGVSPVESMPPPNFPPPTPPIPQGLPFVDYNNNSNGDTGRAGSPSTGRPGLRKNFSSSSLRSMRSRNMSVTNLDGDMSPGTPLSNQFTLGGSSGLGGGIAGASSTRLPPDLPTLPTPSATTFKDRIIIAASGVGGMHLLESDFHSPSTPGSPNPMFSDAPVPLEPCPTDTMLRPFWLMRCLYQTLVHPRGGYLSNKLFVPSDVWKVKGVRLKYLDEKISNCDFLTSALLKLSQVDTCDADAVLEEMQSLETVLEQTQAVLSRKLGNDVGPQSTNALFKEASTGVDNDAVTPGAVPRTSSVSGQSRSFSWRRLRSKNSSAGLGSNYNAAVANGGSGGNGTSGAGGRKESVSEAGGGKDGGGTAPLSSLPMTTQPTRRPAKRDVASAKFSGPNAVYMNALARLFDAAQSIDQIARQVDDPGLRHADKTQVGLELCTRHAAEFFAFYICRFVLSDVSLLLEKFIKRGSEWVLA
ncbi:hypothetical protein SCUCBS95973_006089 [Sporothrix curviconia]|uniref:MIT domain-containing protein n=1 Tax=Sporothrix curviconia TaxID=1260050 RepID=A0ABP0C391_9PEZI